MEVEEKLLHSITVTALGAMDQYGERAPGASTTGVRCYIDGRISRLVNDQGQLIQSDFSILFMPNADIGINYAVADGVDVNGISLLPVGRIVTIEDYNHPSEGQIAREAYVVRG